MSEPTHISYGHLSTEALMVQATGHRSYLGPVELPVSKLMSSGSKRRGEDKANESFGGMVFVYVLFWFFLPSLFWWEKQL